MSPNRLPSLLAALAFIAAAPPVHAIDVAGVERSVDPCVDFYAYANDKWLAESRIADDRARTSAFDEVRERNFDLLARVLDEAITAPLPPEGSPRRMAVQFYASGMDLKAIEEAGLKPLAPLLDTAGSVRDAPSLATALATLQAAGVEAGFAFATRPDARDATHYLAQLAQGGLGLPDRDYYFRTDPRSVAIRDSYRQHVARMLVLAGAEPAIAEKESATVLDLETELARASMTAVQRRDPFATYNKVSPETLAADSPGFDWPRYWNALGVTKLDAVNVQQPAFFKTLGELASKRDPAQWRTYLRWHVLHAAARTLPDAFAQENFAFYDAVLQGLKARPVRQRQVIEIISGRTGGEPMGQALAMIFVDHAFSAHAKARALDLVAHVKAALAERLRTLEWMGDDTRAKALEKLAAMKPKIGYPDRWRDYTGADVGAHVFATNWIESKRYEHRRNVARIGTAVDRGEWFMAPHIVNAQYNGQANEITFPAGILQPPFFDDNADDAVNYGAIGAVIGHEITHGFDDRGRNFDALGNLHDWWSAVDAERYRDRASRVERQYDGYVGVEDIHVNGKLTLGENIADIGGMKIAYLALENVLGPKDSKDRERIDGLTPEQRFFLSFGQLWRSRYRPELERLQLRTDPHSPPRFRVAGVVANLPEFNAAFSCTAKSALLPADQRAAIW
jgi:predicted metalloendopeptidase